MRHTIGFQCSLLLGNWRWKKNNNNNKNTDLKIWGTPGGIYNIKVYKTPWPIKVTGRSKAWTVYAEIMGSSPTQDMDVCVRSFCI
jgi:hypothetical protein